MTEPTPATRPRGPEGFVHRTVRANGINFHVVESGPQDGEPVLLLHGFPEFWYSWRHQLRALADAGFRVFAPDLRGYNLTDQPHDVGSYRTETLVADVAALARALGYDKINVCGHDWGGVLAWLLACMPAHRDVLRRVAILNAPHPRLFFKNMSLRQLRKSWYILFFQLPVLPERMMSQDGLRNLGRSLRAAAARRDAFSAEDVRRYVEAYSRPGAFTGPINYYRAMLRRNPFTLLDGLEPIPREVPALLVWGEKDPALGKELTYGAESVAPHLRIEYIADSGHWVQQEQPERVSRLLSDFFRGDFSRGGAV